MFEMFQNVDVTITDSKFLRSIPYEQVHKYLTAQGWRTEQHGYLTSYTEPMTRKTITLSRNQDSDFELRLRHALEVLHQVYWDNQLVTVERILTAQ